MYFLRFNELPFDSELYKAYKVFPDPKDPLLKDLINKLIVFDPNKRITWQEYFKHKFFEISEDEQKNLENKVQDLVNKYNKLIEDKTKVKEDELMTV